MLCKVSECKMHLHKFVDFWGCIPMIRTFFRYNVLKQIYGEYLSAASGFIQNRFFCILNNLLKYGRRQSHRGRDEIGVSANADKSSVSCGNESIFDSHVRIIIEFYVLFSDSCRNDFSENSARYESGLWNKRVKTIHENRTKRLQKNCCLPPCKTRSSRCPFQIRTAVQNVAFSVSVLSALSFSLYPYESDCSALNVMWTTSFYCFVSFE